MFMASAWPALAGPAIGQFELKDLEAEPGKAEFQSQNAHTFGNPRRKAVTQPGDDPGEEAETVYDDNSVARQRHALELEGSLTHFLRLRVGIEYEKERVEEPDDIALANGFENLKLDEVALEVVTIFKRVPEDGGIGFGALAEFESPVGGDDLSSVNFGPIVEMKSGRWGAVGNLLFIYHFGNGDPAEEPVRDKKWDLGYAAQVSYAASENWTFTVEGYGTFDRLGNTGAPGEERAFFGDHDQHRVGPIVYYGFDASGLGGSSGDDEMEMSDEAEEDGVEVSIGVGVLFGLTEHTPGPHAQMERRSRILRCDGRPGAAAIRAARGDHFPAGLALAR